MPVTPHRRWLGPLFALLLLWLLFFWRILTPSEADRLTFKHGDFTHQFLAYRQMAYRQLLAGRFPFIEECLYSGYPFQADPQSQVLYPPVLALMLVGRALGWSEYPLRALEWEVMLHVLWAALGMYVFLRTPAGHPRLHPIAALVGALVYAFGGYMTGYPMLQTGILQTASWLPWLLPVVHRLATAERWLPAAGGLAIPASFAFTAGHPQTMLYITYVVAVAFVVWFWRAHRFGRRTAMIIGSGLLRGAVAGSLAIGLSAAQLIPSLLFMLDSNRPGLSYIEAGNGFLLLDVALLVLVGVFNIWQPIYVGIVALTLVGVVLLANHKRLADAGLWLLIAVVALALSFGANAIGFDLAYLIFPGYRQFRSQERHAMAVSFALSTLAAYGTTLLMRPIYRQAQEQLKRAAGVTSILGVAALFVLIVILIAQQALTQPAQSALTSAASRLAMVVVALLGASGLFLWRAQLRGWPRWAWGSALVALIVFELFTSNRHTATQQLADPFPPSPFTKPIVDTQRPNSYGRVHNHYGLSLNGACVAGLNEVSGGSPIVMRAYKAFLERTPEAVMVKLLNVRYAVTWRGAMETPEGVMIPWFLLARDTFEGQPASTYRLDWEPQDFNGAWIPRRIVSVRTEDDLYAYMRRPAFDPFVEAVVIDAPKGLLGRDTLGSAAVEGKSPGYIKVAAHADQPALLAISQAYHRNWIALVNGQEVAPLPIYGALLGVPIPAGPASVELSYRPTDFYIGLAISAIAALAIVLLIARAILAGQTRRG
jgi:hypothetical protein